MQKLRSIQVLRGIAAMGVVFHHVEIADASSLMRFGVAVGAAGVDLFFVVSGFIMATIGSGRRPTEFILGRIWRIFPLWLIAVLPWLLAFSYDRETILTSLTLWPIWSGVFHTPALVVGWTLCFEMLFYSGFAVALATRPSVPIIGFIACLALAAPNGVIGYLGSPLILEFLAGVCIARLRPARFPVALITAAVTWLAIAPIRP